MKARKVNEALSDVLQPIDKSELALQTMGKIKNIR